MIERFSYLLAGFSIVIGATNLSKPSDEAISLDGYPKTLSKFGFFNKDADKAGFSANQALIPYNLDTPLFSDHSEKYRYIYIPEGKQAKASDNGSIDFPVGSAIIKNFGYMQKGRMRLIETRVLLRREGEWVALPYVWNIAQDEAILKLAGKRLAISFDDPSGTPRNIDYAVPNKNQCKECHGINNQVYPIGPKTYNLDIISLKRLLQSQALETIGKINAPEWITHQTNDIEREARAYLDINCGHCHNSKGSASNSGLFLNYEESDPVKYGVYKRPVAAGRGSGGLEYAIKPGSAKNSIIIHRMKSNEAGVAMPQIGRSIMDEKGVALVSQWIDEMPRKSQAQQ